MIALAKGVLGWTVLSLVKISEEWSTPTFKKTWRMMAIACGSDSFDPEVDHSWSYRVIRLRFLC